MPDDQFIEFMRNNPDEWKGRQNSFTPRNSNSRIDIFLDGENVQTIIPHSSGKLINNISVAVYRVKNLNRDKWIELRFI